MKFENIIDQAIQDGKTRVQSKIGPNVSRTGEPFGDLRSRDIFTYALVLCAEYCLKEERTTRLKRLHTLFQLAEKMQGPRGNFRWCWKDTRVKDHNAVDFCMRSAALMCLSPHREVIKEHAPEAWLILQRIVKRAVRACWRPVTEKYTNIALMNAANLIHLGEAFEWPHVAQEGYKRLERAYIYTYEWGIHEYCSPTYSAIQLNSLGLILAFSPPEPSEEQNQARKHAYRLLTLLFTHVAQNWLKNPGRLGGTHSRKLSDYLKGDGRIDETLGVILQEMINADSAIPMRAIFPALAFQDKLQKKLKTIFDNEQARPKPLLIQERWGPRTNAWRIHYRHEHISLSTSCTGYDNPRSQDMPLTVDFSPAETSDLQHQFGSIPHNHPLGCYFVSDVDHDPYGRDDRHYAPLLWAATQDLDDALALVLYEPRRRKRLESHFVLPLEEDHEFHIIDAGDNPIINHINEDTIDEITTEITSDIRNAKGAGQPFEKTLSKDAALILKKGETAVGVRTIWTQNLKGGEAPVRFHFDNVSEKTDRDGTPELIKAVRFTVLHHLINNTQEKRLPWTNAGVALRVSIWDGKEYKDWLRKFLDSSRDNLELSATDNNVKKHIRTLKVQAHSAIGNTLEIKTQTSRGKRFVTHLKPVPSQAISKVTENPPDSDETLDQGRGLLIESSGLIKCYFDRLELRNPITAPGAFGVESARTWQPMGKNRENKSRGTTFATTPTENGRIRGSDVGSLTWRVNVEPHDPEDPAKYRKYYLWGRVLAPNPKRASFRIRCFHEAEKPGNILPPPDNLNESDPDLTYPYLAVWPTGVQKKWTWVPIDLSETGTSIKPTPLEFFHTTVTIQLFAHRAGIKIDQLYITDQDDFIPEGRYTEKSNQDAVE